MPIDDTSLSPELSRWLFENSVTTNYQFTPLSGGDINSTALLITPGGEKYVIKRNGNAPHDFFHAEAEGLYALHHTKTVSTPTVVYASDELLVLEYIAPGTPATDYWRKLGRQLAEMHKLPQAKFGFVHDNYCGLTPQPNRQCDDGYEFYRVNRFHHQAELAQQRGLLSRTEVKSVERFALSLPNLIPAQSAALLHGDLWSGNVMCDYNGQAVVIDPAAYWGWPEADLAMTRLFGGFSEEFYHGYIEVNSLTNGWEDRMPIYNLYHLLNHLNLFGGTYYHQVMATLKRFA